MKKALVEENKTNSTKCHCGTRYPKWISREGCSICLGEQKARKPEIRNLNWHRNGVGGRGFYAFTATIQYECHDGSLEEPETYVVTWFPPEDYDKKGEVGEEYCFIVIGAYGPEIDRTMRGDSLMWKIKDELRKVYLAYSKGHDSWKKTYNHIDGKVVVKEKVR